MKLPTHDRYDYVPLRGRPDYSWPGGHGWPSISPSTSSISPSARGWARSWRRAGRSPTCSTSPGATTATGSAPGTCSTPSMRCACRWPRSSTARCTTTRRTWWRRCRARGDEIVGHGRTNAERQGTLDEAAERALIGEATARLTEAEGRAPEGWLGPWISHSHARPTCWPRPATATCSTGAWTTSRSGSAAAAGGASWRCPIRRK